MTDWWCEINGRTVLAYLYLVCLWPTVSGGLNFWGDVCQIFFQVLIPGNLIYCMVIWGQQNPSSKNKNSTIKTQISTKTQKKAIRPCWVESRMMHPWEEAELLIWQSDRGTALCRVFCRIIICLLHTLIHPWLWEHSYSYTMHILLLISCPCGYKTWALGRDYPHLTLHGVCCVVNGFFQTVCTNISKIKNTCEMAVPTDELYPQKFKILEKIKQYLPVISNNYCSHPETHLVNINLQDTPNSLHWVTA